MGGKPTPKPLPNVASPAVGRMLNYAREAGQNPGELVSLVRGEPDFPTPEHISRALWQAIQDGYTHYPQIQGYPELRRAVGDRVRVDHGVEFDPDAEVLITSGGTAGMYLALLATIQPGDEVIMPDPIYDPYANQVIVVGGVPVSVPVAVVGSHFHISAEMLASALTSRTRAIILNTPWNPTGTVLSLSELMTIGEFAAEHELYLLVDEIYEKLLYDDNKHHCLAGLSPAFRDNVITINSFSKTYAMTGWRLGYNLASASLINTMQLYHQHFSRGSTAFVQQAGVAALNGPQTSVDEMVAEYAERRNLMLARLREIDGIRAIVPEGGLFFLVDIRGFGLGAEAMAKYLVREWGLLTVPGPYYGPSLEGYLRLSFSYAREDIVRGVERLGLGLAAAKSLSPSLVR